jgi:hypothetical protein
MRWYKGSIARTWDDSFKELEYRYLDHRYPGFTDEWESGAYSRMKLNGAIHELHGKIPVMAESYIQCLNWHNVGVCLFRMNTGEILPLHSDHYATYKRLFNITDPLQIWRALVMLEDWKTGHYFQIEDTMFSNWTAGDYFVWNYDVAHMAANIGTESRYTMQITGTKL